LKKSTLKFIWKHKRPRITKEILSKNTNTEGVTIPDFKLYYRALTIKTPSTSTKNRQKDQWNGIEDPDINPFSCSHLIFDKGAHNIRWKKTSSSTTGIGKTGSLHAED
jgi:hypothetical protein